VVIQSPGGFHARRPHACRCTADYHSTGQLWHSWHGGPKPGANHHFRLANAGHGSRPTSHSAVAITHYQPLQRPSRIAAAYRSPYCCTTSHRASRKRAAAPALTSHADRNLPGNNYLLG